MAGAEAADSWRDRHPFVARHKIGLGQTAVVLAVAGIVILISSLIARDGSVPAWEESALVFVNDWPDWLEPLVWALQQVGVIGTPIIAAVVVYTFTRRWQYLVAFAAILPLKLLIEKGLIKNLIERERPFVSVGDHINVRGPAFEGLSFPSGHVTTSFAVGVLLASILPPKWRIVAIVWAVIVAIARLYYGEHNLLDVVAGAAIGTAFAVALWLLLMNRVVDERRAEAVVRS